MPASPWTSWRSTSCATLHVTALAVASSSPGTVYAGTYTGVFRSVDGGESWADRSSGLADPFVLALAIDPSAPGTVYAGTFAGVFRSVDGGGHWEAMNTGLDHPIVNALIIDPAAPGRIYAGTFGGGVWDFQPAVESRRPPVLPSNDPTTPRLVGPR